MPGRVDLRSIAIVLLMLILLSVVAVTYTGLKQYDYSTVDRQTAKIAEVIRKAAIQCYALEGQYPPDMAYLAENYGIMIHEDKYIYHYESFGSNISPNIMVFKKFD